MSFTCNGDTTSPVRCSQWSTGRERVCADVAQTFVAKADARAEMRATQLRRGGGRLAGFRLNQPRLAINQEKRFRCWTSNIACLWHATSSFQSCAPRVLKPAQRPCERQARNIYANETGADPWQSWKNMSKVNKSQWTAPLNRKMIVSYNFCNCIYIIVLIRLEKLMSKLYNKMSKLFVKFREFNITYSMLGKINATDSDHSAWHLKCSTLSRRSASFRAISSVKAANKNNWSHTAGFGETTASVCMFHAVTIQLWVWFRWSIHSRVISSLADASKHNPPSKYHQTHHHKFDANLRVSRQTCWTAERKVMRAVCCFSGRLIL